jgi:hypothetical protein
MICDAPCVSCYNAWLTAYFFLELCALVAVAGSNPFIALYFYAFLVIGSFFAINLFIGVVIDKFSRMKEEFEGSAFQTKVSYPDLL